MGTREPVMDYYREYKGHIVAKYSVAGEWIYVVWLDKERLFQCDSFLKAKDWINARG